MNHDTCRGRQAESSALRRPEIRILGVIDVQNFQGRNQRGESCKESLRSSEGLSLSVYLHMHMTKFLWARDTGTGD